MHSEFNLVGIVISYKSTFFSEKDYPFYCHDFWKLYLEYEQSYYIAKFIFRPFTSLSKFKIVYTLPRFTHIVKNQYKKIILPKNRDDCDDFILDIEEELTTIGDGNFDNFDYIYHSVNRFPWFIQYTNKKLLQNKFLARKVAEIDIYQLKCFPNKITNDRALICETIHLNGRFLRELNQKLQNDKEIVLKAVSNYGMSLEFASNRLKKDSEIVIAAIKNDPQSYFFANISLRLNWDIALLALSKGNGRSIFNIPEQLIKNKNFNIEALIKNENLLPLSRLFENDEDFFNKTIKFNRNVWKYMSPSLIGRRDITKLALKYHHFIFNDEKFPFRKDREMILLAKKAIGKNRYYDYRQRNTLLI